MLTQKIKKAEAHDCFYEISNDTILQTFSDFSLSSVKIDFLRWKVPGF